MLIPVHVNSGSDRANAVDTAIYATADVLGPGITGLLAGFLGLIAIAFAYAVGAAAAIAIPRRSPHFHRQV